MSYGHKMAAGVAVKARLIRASCRVASWISSAVRPGQMGSPTNRTRRPRWASVKSRMAGMIRPGLRPRPAMSVKATCPFSPFRLGRSRLI